MTPLPPVVVEHPHVRVLPGVLGGSPHIAETRVPVRRLWAWLQGGCAIETLVRRYPDIPPSRIYDALSFAYDNRDIIAADLAREEALHAALAAPGARRGGTEALPRAPVLPGP